jgi:hypothetical protein
VDRIMDRIVTDITKAELGRHSRGEAARCPPPVSDIKKRMCGIS